MQLNTLGTLLSFHSYILASSLLMGIDEEKTLFSARLFGLVFEKALAFKILRAGEVIAGSANAGEET